MTFDARPLQTALAAQTPPYDPGPIDGVFGEKTQAAMNHWQRDHGLEETFAPVAEVFIGLGIPLPPEMPEAPPAPPPKPPASPSIFDQIGTLLSIINLLKGKTMTQDQINGLIRSALLTLGGFLIGRGLVTAELWAWISAGVLTVGPAVWSWISNRPKTILSLADKAALGK